MPEIVAPDPHPHGEGLIRVLWPDIRRARATLPRVRTAADAGGLGRSLWSDAAIRRALQTTGRRVWLASDRAWTPRRTDGARFDAAPVDGTKLVDGWTRAAFGLIKSLRAEVAEGLRQDIVDALEHGTPIEQVQRRWVQQGIPVKFGTLEGRTKVIAHHQVSSLNAEVQRARARAVGVEDFRWQTRGDSAVREAHRKLNGKTFPYDKPPAEGLPGQPVGCRCRAVSIVPAALLQ